MNFLPLSCSDVTQSGFCTGFCGWHTFIPKRTRAYKFGWIGLAPSTCSGCIRQKTSPNGDAAVDAAISVIAHELVETATDPTLNGWCYSGSNPSCAGAGVVENGDQCAWDFPSAIYLHGFRYNIVVGGLKYLIQSNWNLSTKTCRMS